MSYSQGGCDTIRLANDFSSSVGDIFFDSSSLSNTHSSTAINFLVSENILIGDAKTMSYSQGGCDTIRLANDFLSRVGDINFDSRSLLTTNSSTATNFNVSNNELFGDAESMIHSKGGSDILSIGVGIFSDSPVNLQIFENMLFGDAKTMTHSQGGNDKLTGADGKGSVTYLYGDAQFTDGHSKAGNDVLTSGRGNDQMWGDFASVLNPATSSNDHDHEDDDGGYGWDEHESDHDDDHHAFNPYKYAGKDTFVFKENNGNDTIFDFQHGLDKIDLSAANIFSVDGFHIEQSAAHPSDTVIDLGGGNSITLVGVSDVVETDFVFAGISI